MAEAGVGGEQGVVGEDVGLGDFVERLVGEGEVAAMGIEEDEVVGEVGGGRDVGLEEEAVEGAAGSEVTAGDAELYEVAEAEIGGSELEEVGLEAVHSKHELLVNRFGSFTLGQLLIGHIKYDF